MLLKFTAYIARYLYGRLAGINSDAVVVVGYYLLCSTIEIKKGSKWVVTKSRVNV